MSMMDETPDYFIRDGKIFVHHSGSSYASGGFVEHEPSYNQYIGDATPSNINDIVLKHQYVYNYDTSCKQEIIKSDYQDAFLNDIFEGSIVYCMDNFYNDTFAGFIKGKVIGFTDQYVKIKPIQYDKINRWHSDIEYIRRTPHRVIVIE